MTFQATAERRCAEGYALLLGMIFAETGRGWRLYDAIWCAAHADRNQRFAAIGNPDKRGE